MKPPESVVIVTYNCPGDGTDPHSIELIVPEEKLADPRPETVVCFEHEARAVLEA